MSSFFHYLPGNNMICLYLYRSMQSNNILKWQMPIQISNPIPVAYTKYTSRFFTVQLHVLFLQSLLKVQRRRDQKRKLAQPFRESQSQAWFVVPMPRDQSGPSLFKIWIYCNIFHRAIHQQPQLYVLFFLHLVGFTFSLDHSVFVSFLLLELVSSWLMAYFNGILYRAISHAIKILYLLGFF